MKQELVKTMIKVTDTKSAEASMVLPAGGMQIYNHDNWEFSQVMDFKTEHGTIFRIVAQHKGDGFEDLTPYWDLTEKDLELLGGGTIDGLRDYVIEGFFTTLDNKKEQYLNQLRNAGGLG